MIKVKSKTDVITNSSNETFIMKHKPYSDHYNSCHHLDDFDDIRSGGDGYFNKDLMVFILDHYFKSELIDNPLPIPSYGNESPWFDIDINDPDKVWSDLIWIEFVDKNKKEFEKLLDLYYVSGPYDHDYSDYYEWESINDDLKDESIMSSGRGGNFIF